MIAHKLTLSIAPEKGSKQKKSLRGIRTLDARVKIWSANHYTIRPAASLLNLHVFICQALMAGFHFGVFANHTGEISDKCGSDKCEHVPLRKRGFSPSLMRRLLLFNKGK